MRARKAPARAPAPIIPYFLPFLGGAAASCLHMVPVSPQALHFLGLQRVSMLLPHFSQVKVAIGFPPFADFSAQAGKPVPPGIKVFFGDQGRPINDNADQTAMNPNISPPRMKVFPAPLFQSGVLKSPFAKGGFRGIWGFTIKSAATWRRPRKPAPPMLFPLFPFSPFPLFAFSPLPLFALLL